MSYSDPRYSLRVREALREFWFDVRRSTRRLARRLSGRRASGAQCSHRHRRIRGASEHDTSARRRERLVAAFQELSKDEPREVERPRVRLPAGKRGHPVSSEVGQNLVDMAEEYERITQAQKRLTQQLERARTTEERQETQQQLDSLWDELVQVGEQRSDLGRLYHADDLDAALEQALQ